MIIEMFPHYCSTIFAYTLFQGVPDILKYGLCPAMLTPSKPCELDLYLSVLICKVAAHDNVTDSN